MLYSYRFNQESQCILVLMYIVASELKDPICHSNECQIGSFSSVATICTLLVTINLSVCLGLSVLCPLKATLLTVLNGLNCVAMDYTLPLYCIGQSTLFTNPMLGHHLRRWHTIKSTLMRCIHPLLLQRLRNINDAGPLLRETSQHM